jgi:enterochelin esterase-like enzyme/outer membrane protein assembly factor BamB
MFASGEVDVVAALDLKSGDELWRYELGEKYEGHDGSDDGPVGTPTVSKNVVFALGPRGRLVALSLADGKEIWQRELTEENSTPPFSGYTSSPLVVGDHVILATGGEGHAVTAFDRASGATKWTAGDDSVSYQTPMLVELGGRSQLIAATDRMLQGLDPTSGEILWQLQHTEGDEIDRAPHPTVVDDERILVKYGRGASLYRWTGDGVEEIWSTRAFGNTFAQPAYIDGDFYGFSGTVLTCVDGESGEILWRSRELNSFGMTEVDGKLAVLTRDGELVLVNTSPDGYEEMTRIKALENGDYAVPSFVDGRFVVRNLAQMASVSVDASAAPRVAEAEVEERLLGEFGRWVATVEALPEVERAAEVEAGFPDEKTTPLFEDGGLVHFVWREGGDDVAVLGTFSSDGRELGLHRVEGTDLFFRSLQLDPKAEYTYNFIVDFGDARQDPHNPYSVDNGFRVTSELRMPEWPASPHLDPPAEDAPSGTLDRFQFRSEILENTREIQLWRPAGYDRDAERRYPVLVVNHGDNLVRGGLMQNALDNLVGQSVAPLIAVFVPRASGAEYGGPAAENYMRFLVEELLPHVDRHYRTDSADRAIMGPGSAGVAAVLAAFTHPEVFRRAAVQSFYPIPPTHERLPELITAEGAKPELVYVVWSRNDYDLGEGRNAAIASAELLGWLREAGLEAVEQVADYTPGWGGWRGQYDEILPALFPLAAEE